MILHGLLQVEKNVRKVERVSEERCTESFGGWVVFIKLLHDATEPEVFQDSLRALLVSRVIRLLHRRAFRLFFEDFDLAPIGEEDSLIVRTVVLRVPMPSIDDLMLSVGWLSHLFDITPEFFLDEAVFVSVGNLCCDQKLLLPVGTPISLGLTGILLEARDLEVVCFLRDRFEVVTRIARCAAEGIT